MNFKVRFTEDAEADLARLHECILQRDDSKWELAERALQAIEDAVRSEQSILARIGDPVWRHGLRRAI